MAIIKNPLTIVQTGGESQVPEYMSAKNFTFDGNACTGYVGDNSFPEIIIPKSYSKIDTVTTRYTFVNISNISTLNNGSLTSITLCNKDGSNEHTYLDSDQLRLNFNRDFAGQSEVRINSFSYSTNFLTNTAFKNYIKDILFAPIVYNNKIYNTIDEFVEMYITSGRNTISPLSGQTVESTFFDGDDYQVTAVASNNDSSSGFRNYYNKVILLNNITSIGANAFNSCRNLSEISMPSTITDIDEYAFFNCQNLKMITIPPNVNSIGRSSFLSCSNLTSAIIPEGVTSIGSDTFSETGLIAVMLSSTVTSIGARAFEDCLYLQSLIVNNNNNTYHSKDNCIIKTNTKELVVGCNTSIIPADNTVTSIAGSAFRGGGISSINIPDNITLIDEFAFRDCTSLQTVNFGENSQLQTIGQYAFNNCRLLNSITIPANITNLDNAIFQSCSSLATVTFAEGSQLESIETSAFSSCRSLTEITLPASVTSIGSYAFNNCSSLTTMTILATTPPTLGGTNAISSATTRIYIPAGTLSAYQSATNWSNFASLFEELPA